MFRPIYIAPIDSVICSFNVRIVNPESFWHNACILFIPETKGGWLGNARLGLETKGESDGERLAFLLIAD
jgi:hypothetical protein